MNFSKKPQKHLLISAPDNYTALVLAQMTRATNDVLHICRDDTRLTVLTEQLAFFAPDITVLPFPAWDTVPYDRVSPNTNVIAKRMETLSVLSSEKTKKSRLVITTANAILQRVPPVDFFRSSLSLRAGDAFDEKAFNLFLEKNGYQRTEQVMEPGEYAVRGGIIDVFAPGTQEPLRLDLFGDELESIRTFDPISQRTTGKTDCFTFKPVSEVALDEQAVSRFRTNYREMFGSGVNDILYESISEGRRFQGMEHWLPLFHEGMDTLFAFLPDSVVSLDYQTEEAVRWRCEQINEFYQARKQAEENGLSEAGMIYHPVAVESFFLSPEELNRSLAGRAVYQHFPFETPSTGAQDDVIDAQGRAGRDFSAERVDPDVDLYDAVRKFIVEQRLGKKKVVLCSYSSGSRSRIAALLKEHGVPTDPVQTWDQALKSGGETPFVVLPLERGFQTKTLCVISETDILGDRLVRSVKRKRKNDQFIGDVSVLNEGDLVVHIDHGIGRYNGLETLQVGGAPHDCVCLVYADGDKLFVPVENIEVLSRYGSDQSGAVLDKLGGVAWQARKSKLKKRIKDMAEALIKIAAERYLRKADILPVPTGVYDDFCARFPYVETEDQEKSIQDVLNDMTKGRPMDRLVCGDVGFGKTEVALRAAFTAAMNGVQVAVVVPTTLLARQHYETFLKRLTGFPLRVDQLSRLTPSRHAGIIKKELMQGSLDIVVGTHALLAKTVSFKNLGLLIVDEEQHFGVAHKERLKQLRSNIHVLTLTATPIPRTLQMALTGVRELSIIATPPVDRLAVRTFVLPFDPVIIREALIRERMRGGQTFYVCPRISDMDEVIKKLKILVPEIKVVAAHGRMTPKEIEDIMTAFSDKKYDVLVSTSIIESGIDMPSVNTIIVHRADMFGLAQLYQLRGRVGRSKIRGYAYLTLPNAQKVNKTALKRMEVMQKLDNLGAGFTLASYDLDIRGAGNLLGEEQSGHIKEVGIELYQKMLEEAVAEARNGDTLQQDGQETWSPQINIGMPVLIPESYVRDLGIRMGLYKRLAEFTELNEIEAFGAEMADRFGNLPPEVENLLEIIAIKTLCRKANVEKIEAGPKGAVVSLRNNRFPNPAGLVKFIAQNNGTVKLRADQKIVYKRVWDVAKDRIKGIRKMMDKMAKIALEVK